MKKKVVAIIQARMNSTRLPGKVLMKIAGKPVISYVVNRVAKSKKINEVWLATTDAAADDVLVRWAKINNVKYFRGSEANVLDRYYQTALLAQADTVVRITGDCPLIDPIIIDKVLSAHLAGDYDYTSNIHPPTYPDGLDIEVFSEQALSRAWKEASLPSEREHVTPYIWKNLQIFKIHNVEHDDNLSMYRWTLDTKEDSVFLRGVISACEKQNGFCDMKKILKIIKNNPNWQNINKMYTRNEGYAKSIQQDVEGKE